MSTGNINASVYGNNYAQPANAYAYPVDTTSTAYADPTLSQASSYADPYAMYGTQGASYVDPTTAYADPTLSQGYTQPITMAGLPSAQQGQKKASFMDKLKAVGKGVMNAPGAMIKSLTEPKNLLMTAGAIGLSVLCPPLAPVIATLGVGMAGYGAAKGAMTMAAGWSAGDTNIIEAGATQTTAGAAGVALGAMGLRSNAQAIVKSQGLGGLANKAELAAAKGKTYKVKSVKLGRFGNKSLVMNKGQLAVSGKKGISKLGLLDSLKLQGRLMSAGYRQYKTYGIRGGATASQGGFLGSIQSKMSGKVPSNGFLNNFFSNAQAQGLGSLSRSQRIMMNSVPRKVAAGMLMLKGVKDLTAVADSFMKSPTAAKFHAEYQAYRTGHYEPGTLKLTDPDKVGFGRSLSSLNAAKTMLSRRNILTSDGSISWRGIGSSIKGTATQGKDGVAGVYQFYKSAGYKQLLSDMRSDMSTSSWKNPFRGPQAAFERLQNSTNPVQKMNSLDADGKIIKVRDMNGAKRDPESGTLYQDPKTGNYLDRNGQEISIVKGADNGYNVELSKGLSAINSLASEGSNVRALGSHTVTGLGSLFAGAKMLGITDMIPGFGRSTSTGGGITSGLASRLGMSTPAAALGSSKYTMPALVGGSVAMGGVNTQKELMEKMMAQQEQLMASAGMDPSMMDPSMMAAMGYGGVA